MNEYKANQFEGKELEDASNTTESMLPDGAIDLGEESDCPDFNPFTDEDIADDLTVCPPTAIQQPQAVETESLPTQGSTSDSATDVQEDSELPENPFDAAIAASETRQPCCCRRTIDMLFSIDMIRLVERLRQAEEAEKIELSDGVRYLMETVYSTLLANEHLAIGDIDFTCFEHEDVWDFKTHLDENVEKKKENVEKVRALFQRYQPKALARRTFF